MDLNSPTLLITGGRRVGVCQYDFMINLRVFLQFLLFKKLGICK